jgi:hypothetical protein
MSFSLQTHRLTAMRSRFLDVRCASDMHIVYLQGKETRLEIKSVFFKKQMNELFLKQKNDNTQSHMVYRSHPTSSKAAQVVIPTQIRRLHCSLNDEGNASRSRI